MDVVGQPIDLVKVLATAGAQAYRPVVDGDRRPANRVILPTYGRLSPRKALLEGGPTDRNTYLAGHGITRPAWAALDGPEPGRFAEKRAQFLAGKMRESL